jgi:hypothetical protein
MEQIPSSEYYSCLASQEVPLILRKPDVHYRIHNSPLLVSVLSQISPIHAPHPIS